MNEPREGTVLFPVVNYLPLIWGLSVMYGLNLVSIEPPPLSSLSSRSNVILGSPMACGCWGRWREECWGPPYWRLRDRAEACVYVCVHTHTHALCPCLSYPFLWVSMTLHYSLCLSVCLCLCLYLLISYLVCQSVSQSGSEALSPASIFLLVFWYLCLSLCLSVSVSSPSGSLYLIFPSPSVSFHQCLLVSAPAPCDLRHLFRGTFWNGGTTGSRLKWSQILVPSRPQLKDRQSRHEINFRSLSFISWLFNSVIASATLRGFFFSSAIFVHFMFYNA